MTRPEYQKAHDIVATSIERLTRHVEETLKVDPEDQLSLDIKTALQLIELFDERLGMVLEAFDTIDAEVAKLAPHEPKDI